jgi:3-oxoadipate enol-lactonase
MRLGVAASDGTSLAVDVSGPAKAPALLFLNSLGCDLTLWDEQAAALADAYRIVRFDARGHGGSGAPPGDYTLEQLGRDALAVLDAVGVASAHVCGLSLGGATAQWVAIHAPERIDRLVLANTASRIGSAEAWEARRRTVLAEGVVAIADTAMDRFFSAAFRADHADIVAQYRTMLTNTPATGYAGCCAALRDGDLAPGLGRIRAPTLVIAGELDVSTPPEQALSLAARIAGSELRLLATAHLSTVEDPAGFTGALRSHLERR